MEPDLPRILSLRPTHRNTALTQASAIEEVCRLGTHLFLAPLWRSFGINPVQTKRIKQNLLFLLNGYFAEWGMLRPLLLWTLAHAVREAEEAVEREDFAIRLAMVVAKMRLTGWEDVIKEFKGVL